MKNLLRISTFLRPYTGQVIASLVMLLMLTGLNLLVPRIIQSVIDDGLVGGQTNNLIRSALLLFALGLGSAILNLFHRYTSEWIAVGVGYDLRNRMYDHIQHLPFTYHDHKIGSDTLARALVDRQGRRVTYITAFSFYATKNMTTGEGGMITTNDDDLAEHMRVLTLHGMSRDAWKRYTSAGSWYYEVVLPGYKDNMTDIQAALGIHQLRRLDSFIEARQRYARLYDKAFADLGEVATPVNHPDRNHVYHIYVIRLCLERLAIDRAQFMDELRSHNIGASVHFIPVHLHPFYQERFGYRRGDFPQAEATYDRIVSLPLYPRMTEIDVHDVIRAVRQIIARHRINSPAGDAVQNRQSAVVSNRQEDDHVPPKHATTI